MSFDADKSELALDIWEAEEALEAERRGKIQCDYCEEYYNQQGMWLVDVNAPGIAHICPDCWLDYIWENYITGCSFGQFKDFLRTELKVKGEK